ncbi:MAG: VWA domain-containing protein [Sulfurimonas sp.]|nr:VWA domain-containing protein [Sulfurimonas sp.]
MVKSEQKSRFGVLGFTTNAIILSPLTQDTQLLLHLFSALDEKLIMTKGSSIMPALHLARKMSKSPSVSVVLLTDGGDELNYEDEARVCKEKQLRSKHHDDSDKNRSNSEARKWGTPKR